MKQAACLFGAIAVLLIVLDFTFGYAVAYSISYGAISMMAAMISLTFLWLWYKRTTPLALGMSLSWAGASSVMGWWWLYAVLDRPTAMLQNEVLLVFVSLYCVGAILHFGVIQQSLQLHRSAYLVPILGSVLLSAAVHLLV